VKSKGASKRKSLEELENEAKEEAKGKEINREELLTRKIVENLCTACSLFGSTELGSRVYFKDMFLSEGVPIRVEIRDGIAIDRDTGTVKEKFKFDYEIVPRGAKFGFEAVLENVEDWELGLIAMILKLWENGNLTLGGKISAGLGWGTLKIKEVGEVDNKNLVDFLVEGKTRKVNLDHFISALKNKIKRVPENA
jgi:CRISPR-associated RAMP protein (TIGR02581 family)